MITCHLCYKFFKTVKDFELHIDTDCANMAQRDAKEYVGTQILHPDGTSEFRKLYQKASDDWKHNPKSDEEVTEPSMITAALEYSLFLFSELENTNKR